MKKSIPNKSCQEVNRKGGKKMKKLTKKQKKFIEVFLYEHLNGTKAVLIAYPNVKNRNTAAVMAYELLSKPKIRKIVDYKLKRDLASISF